MTEKDPIKEAKRYLRNGNKLLRENCTVDDFGHYSDKKYVKMAGDIAWKAILEALDPFHPKSTKKQKSVDSYKDILKKRDWQLVQVYECTYNMLYLNMGYDGITDTNIKKIGWQNAKILINWAEKTLPETIRVGLSDTKKK